MTTTNVDAGHLEVADLSHTYGHTRVLEDVSMSIQRGEFLTLLGPSGCGKTTLLRIMSGFLRPTNGTVRLDGKNITDTRPNKRPMNLVFQRPTLFPHLDVYGNVAFGLQVARLGRSETRRRVDDALELVQLGGYQRRKAHELSGGQMQRVALARALVNRPRVLLLDEPLSALDMRIRLEMETELRRLHVETGATFVYVTHDQREALALSDRIAVMDRGRVEQVDTPQHIYSRPSSPFAARFVGDANVSRVDVLGVDEVQATIRVCGRVEKARAAGDLAVGPGLLVVRPDTARIVGPKEGILVGKIADIAFRGTGFGYQVIIDGLERPFKVEMSSTGHDSVEIGTNVGVTWSTDSGYVIPDAPDAER